jgi:hypothetical protein
MRETVVVPDPWISFSKVIADAVKKAHNRKALYAIVRRESQGKTRDEAREILVSETRRAGGEPIGQPFLDRQLDVILTSDSPVEKARQFVDGMGAVFKVGANLVNTIRSTGNDHPDFADRPDISFRGDRHFLCQVLLADGVEDWIGELPSVGSISYRDLGFVRVKLTRTAPRAVGAEIAITVNGRRAGVLDPAHSEPFWDLWDADGVEPDDVAGTVAFRTLDVDGTWRLDVGAPENIRRSIRWQDPSSE